MVFSKFSNCQVTSQEAPWIKKPPGSLVLSGVDKLNQCRRYGEPGGRAPLTTACAPPFQFTQNTILQHHVTTTGNNRKKNNYVQR